MKYLGDKPADGSGAAIMRLQKTTTTGPWHGMQRPIALVRKYKKQPEINSQYQKPLTSHKTRTLMAQEARKKRGAQPIGTCLHYDAFCVTLPYPSMENTCSGTLQLDSNLYLCLWTVNPAYTCSILSQMLFRYGTSTQVNQPGNFIRQSLLSQEGTIDRSNTPPARSVFIIRL